MTIIRKMRKARNMTQEALAAALGVTQGCVNHWETGRARPSVDNLKAMAKLFGCSVDDLLE